MSITVKDTDGNPVGHLYQWDVGRELTISGADTSESVAVHFKNRRSETALVVEPTVENEVITVRIPNELLTHAEELVAYVYTGTTGNAFRTVHEIRIPVIARQKPADYVFEDNVEYVNLGEAIRNLEGARIIVEQGKLKFELGSGAGNYITTLTALKGDPGDTPVKGTDYFTAADKAELVDALRLETAAADVLTEDQLAAVNSGITSGIIPQTASESNPLTDRDFVNSSIATSTATFFGTYNSLSTLRGYTEAHHGVDENDYAFVVSTDSAGNTKYDRYKYTEESGWTYEYTLNNSSFTAEQWAAISSGITAAKVSAIDGKYEKPSGGIPKTDLASAVRTSLSRADTAVLNHSTVPPTDDGYLAVNADRSELSWSGVRLANVCLKSDFTSETWMFTLADNTTVTKKVVLLP